MKKINYILFALFLFTIAGCRQDFLEKKPQGELTVEQLTNQKGVNGLLTHAYSMLNGNLNGTWGNYASGPSQWLLGEVTSDNAHKGSDPGDQPNMNDLERHNPNSTNDNLSAMWTRCFEGIQACNSTLKILAILQADGSETPFSAARAIEIQGEARLLRAHYYFFLARAFKNVPLITESTTDPAVDNTPDIYPSIVADLKYASDNLAAVNTQAQVGRMNKIIAQAYLGKVLLYQKKYSEALPLFNAVIAAKGGVNAITTMPYTDNFDITKENGPETIFSVQMSVGGDGSGGDNGNVGDMLNFPYGSDKAIVINCCGFFQPSFDLANAFKVDANGLPFLDKSYRNNPYKSDFGVADKANYQLDRTLAIDTRMDYTMGRRGVPYLDWGIMVGDTWIRNAANGGPFLAYKNVIDAAQIATGSAPGSPNVTGLNVNLIRLADVYLMAAECEVEVGSLSNALILVNNIRRRAALIKHKVAADGVTKLAAYNIGLYPSFPDKPYAESAVRFERRLELSMEGHRFYDLVRWGTLKTTMESYFGFEGTYLTYLKGLTILPRDNYFPIPQEQIDRSNKVLKQNTGY